MKKIVNKNYSLKYKKGIDRNCLIRFVEDETTSIEQFCIRYNITETTLKKYLKKTYHNTINITLLDYYNKNKVKKEYVHTIDNSNSELNNSISIRNLSLGVNKATKVYSINLIKNKYLEHGFLKPCCYKCNFSDYRVFDYKKPLLLNFINGDKKDLRTDNLELLCYNCYFIYIGDILNGNLGKIKGVKSLQDLDEVIEIKKINEFDIDTETAKKLDINIYNKNDDKDYEDPYSLVSYNV